MVVKIDGDGDCDGYDEVIMLTVMMRQYLDDFCMCPIISHRTNWPDMQRRSPQRVKLMLQSIKNTIREH